MSDELSILNGFKIGVQQKQESLQDFSLFDFGAFLQQKQENQVPINTKKIRALRPDIIKYLKLAYRTQWPLQDTIICLYIYKIS